MLRLSTPFTPPRKTMTEKKKRKKAGKFQKKRSESTLANLKKSKRPNTHQ